MKGAAEHVVPVETRVLTGGLYPRPPLFPVEKGFT